MAATHGNLARIPSRGGVIHSNMQHQVDAHKKIRRFFYGTRDVVRCRGEVPRRTSMVVWSLFLLKCPIIRSAVLSWSPSHINQDIHVSSSLETARVSQK